MVIHVLHIIRDVIGYAFLGYIAVWVLAIAVMAFIGVVLVISRGSPDAVRDVFRQVVAARASTELIHVAGQAESPAGVGGALRQLRTADPHFDINAFLDSARVAVGAYAVAQLGRDDRLLRRIATPGFWGTHHGKMIAGLVATERRRASHRADTSHRGPAMLDVSWRQPVVQDVALSQRGMDRITVRLASVFIGAIPAAGPNPSALRRFDAATQLDWEFVRPAGHRTDPEAVLLPRTCASCGGPYRSEFDDACPYCHAPRADSQAGWRLDRNYLVVDSGGR
jgi:hypothetical protein